MHASVGIQSISRLRPGQIQCVLIETPVALMKSIVVACSQSGLLGGRAAVQFDQLLSEELPGRELCGSFLCCRYLTAQLQQQDEHQQQQQQ